MPWSVMKLHKSQNVTYNWYFKVYVTPLNKWLERQNGYVSHNLYQRASRLNSADSLTTSHLINESPKSAEVTLLFPTLLHYASFPFTSVVGPESRPSWRSIYVTWP